MLMYFLLLVSLPLALIFACIMILNGRASRDDEQRAAHRAADASRDFR